MGYRDSEAAGAYLPDGPPPKTLAKSRRVNGVMHVAGEGPAPADIMFVATSVCEEEAEEFQRTAYGKEMKSYPRYLKGPAGTMFKDLASSCGVHDGEYYYTALCKWLMPKATRGKPKKDQIAYGMEMLVAEIEAVKPKIIVFLGKPVFDQFFDMKIKLKEISGGWFRNERFGCLMYPMDDTYRMVSKPETYELFRIDMLEVSSMLRQVRGAVVPKIEKHYRKVCSAAELEALVDGLEAGNHKILSVDTEFHGRNHVDGMLRSLQICWKPGHAAYIRFMDENMEYVLDVPYEEAGRILGRWLDRPDVKYVGHHCPADLAPMAHTLGLQWYGKVLFDTEFAQQAADEFAPLKLERMAMAYTDLGRYDIDLVLWKKKNAKLLAGRDGIQGYGRVPEEILLPYACLRTDSLVELEGGKWEQIGRLVRTRYAGRVKCLVDGVVSYRKVVGWHRRSVGQMEWFKIRTASSGDGRWGLVGPAFTPDHKILTQLGRVMVSRLEPGKHRVATDQLAMSKEQRAVLLGTLLGDGGIARRNKAGCGLKISQSGQRVPYLMWKVESLSGPLEFHTRDVGKRGGNSTPMRVAVSRHSKELADIREAYPVSSANMRKKLKVTKELLETLGPLGVAVWYQDDGTYTKDGQARIYCRKLQDDEIKVVEDYFGNLFPGTYYNRKGGFVCFNMQQAAGFLDWVAPYAHPSVSYKFGGRKLSGYKVKKGTGVYYAHIKAVEDAYRGKEGDGVRYCISVEEAECFHTQEGFVSNCSDADAVMRIYPQILGSLVRQNLLSYYMKLFQPFVADVFTSFALVGLPVNMDRLDELRRVYTFCRDKLNDRLVKSVFLESRRLFLARCMKKDPREGPRYFAAVRDCMDAGDEAGALEVAKRFFGPQELASVEPFLQHMACAGMFNIRSTAHMRRWLFDVKGYEPIKSTANKENGMPSMAWEKVRELPESRRREYSPSTDSQTIKILAQQGDKILGMLLQVNAIGNVCKAFLKEDDTDEDGEVIRENGLHFWITDDKCVHGMFSTTETGRPRSWNPNSLNWPGWVNKRITDGMKEVFAALPDEEVPEDLRKFRTEPIGSVRSCIEAPEGWCIVESDYQTAELRGQAFISGDEAMIRLFTEKDPCFALPKPEVEPDKDCVVRVDFPADGSIPEHGKDPQLLMTYTVDNVLKRRFSEEELLRDAEGRIVHHKHDLHWSLAERQHKKPREKLNNKKDRSSAKIGNFSSAYGAQGPTLERKIEEETGLKPEEGTGQAILDALQARQPVATKFLESMEEIPVDPGFYRAASGRIRHFYLHPEHAGVSRRARDGHVSALGREARNFPFQESVAATAARAANWCLWFAMRMGLKGRPMAVLYDSVVTLCPEEERFVWEAAHEFFMYLANGWEYHGRILRYPIDTDLGKAWSAKSSKEYKARLADRGYKPQCARLAAIEGRLKELCEAYLDNDRLSLAFDPARVEWPEGLSPRGEAVSPGAVGAGQGKGKEQ